MALCIAAATSLFTVTRSVLLRPLPFRDPDRLVMLYEHFRDPKMNAQGFNYIRSGGAFRSDPEADCSTRSGVASLRHIYYGADHRPIIGKRQPKRQPGRSFCSAVPDIGVGRVDGVLSYLTAQRTGEIGVRMALGAEGGQVLRLMLGDGMRPALYGLTVGLATSAGVVRLIQSTLYRTEPIDTGIFVAAAATLLGSAVLACLVPAWRASQIDAMQALRIE